VRYNQQRRKRLQTVHGPTNYFKAGWVEPVHVLENHQDRVGTRQSLQLGRQRIQCLLAPLLSFEFEDRIASSFGSDSISANRAVSTGEVKLCATGHQVCPARSIVKPNFAP
jgi:hypothetical protein